MHNYFKLNFIILLLFYFCVCVNFQASLPLRFLSTAAPRTLTLIPGDGIGPEISDSVIKVYETAKVLKFYNYIFDALNVMQIVVKIS